LVMSFLREESIPCAGVVWLPGVDSNHHYQIQSLASCR
jgi:hypothetical protein